MTQGVNPAAANLQAAIHRYLLTTYSNPPVKLDESVDEKLGWVPSLSCSVSNQLMLIECSESLYPVILRLRRAEMVEVDAPIAAYVACPEEAYTANQKEAVSLAAHGFGLFTVDAAGGVTCKFNAIPIAQHITDSDFKRDIEGLPVAHRRMAQEGFDLYKRNAPAGVAFLAEQLEALSLRAAKDAVNKSWLTNATLKKSLASILTDLQSTRQMQNADTAIVTMRTFVSRYRNVAHHVPKNKKQAVRKYRDCRHAFLDGLRNMRDFRDAMKVCGLSGGV